MIETDHTLWTVGAGQGRKEAGRLAHVTLSLVIREQFKRLPLRLGDALEMFKKLKTNNGLFILEGHKISLCQGFRCPVLPDIGLKKRCGKIVCLRSNCQIEIC